MVPAEHSTRPNCLGMTGWNAATEAWKLNEKKQCLCINESREIELTNDAQTF